MLTVSNYHYIRPNFDSKFPSIFGVTPFDFKQQLLLLKGAGDFVSSNELLSNLDLILNSKDNFFFITFDDGLKEQYNYAIPILNDLQIPVVLFANSRIYEDKKVTTVHKIHLLRSLISPTDFLKNISKGSRVIFSNVDEEKAKSIYVYDDLESACLKYLLNFKIHFSLQEELINTIFDNYFEEKQVVESLYMNEHEIIQLSKIHSLGSHTHNHFPIGLLKEEEMKFELENSKHFFENLTNSKIEMVAYPYGSPEACTNEVAKIAQQVGYKIGFTTTRGVNTEKSNTLLLHRFDCNDLPGGKNYKL